MYDVSPDGADSSTKVDLSRQVFRLSGNKTLGSQSVTSNGAGGSPAEAIIRKHQNRAGPFLKFEKNTTWPPENRGSVAVRFHLKIRGFRFQNCNSPRQDVTDDRTAKMTGQCEGARGRPQHCYIACVIHY